MRAEWRVCTRIRPQPWFRVLKYRQSRVFRGPDEPEFFPRTRPALFCRSERQGSFLLPPCGKEAPSLKSPKSAKENRHFLLSTGKSTFFTTFWQEFTA